MERRKARKQKKKKETRKKKGEERKEKHMNRRDIEHQRHEETAPQAAIEWQGSSDCERHQWRRKREFGAIA